MGGMVTWLARELGYGEQCDQLKPVDQVTTMTIGVLKQYKFISEGQGRGIFEWKVGGKTYCLLPNERADLDPEFREWTFPGADVDSENSSDEGGAPEVPPPHPYPGYIPPIPHYHPPPTFAHGEGSSSATPFFNPCAEFPPSYFGTSSTPPPPPRDPYDLTPMYHMLGQLHRRMDETSRVVWHDHTHLVNSGLVPGFANHPSYPPDFDSPFLPLQPQPDYFPPGHPFYRPPPPPPPQ